MHRKIFMVGTFLTSIGVILLLISLIGYTLASTNQDNTYPAGTLFYRYQGEKDAYSAVGGISLLFLLFGIPILIIGGIIKTKEQRQQIPQQPPISYDRHCPNCGRAIPIDARICPYCKKDFEQK